MSQAVWVRIGWKAYITYYKLSDEKSLRLQSFRDCFRDQLIHFGTENINELVKRSQTDEACWQHIFAVLDEQTIMAAQYIYHPLLSHI